MTIAQGTTYTHRNNLYLLNDGVIFTCSQFHGEACSTLTATIVVARSDWPIKVSAAGSMYRASSLAIRPGVKHATSFGVGRHVYIRLTPSHPLFRRFCAIRAPGVLPLDCNLDGMFAPELDSAYWGTLQRHDAERLLRGIAAGIAGELPAIRVADARIDRAKRMLWERPDCTAEELSSHFGLSIYRMSHLFKSATGLPIKTYRRWQRMHAATAQLSSGRSLTEIATAAGYTDLSHFGREFRELAGMSPRSLFLSDQIRVFHWRHKQIAPAGGRAESTSQARPKGAAQVFAP